MKNRWLPISNCVSKQSYSAVIFKESSYKIGDSFILQGEAGFLRFFAPSLIKIFWKVMPKSEYWCMVAAIPSRETMQNSTDMVFRRFDFSPKTLILDCRYTGTYFTSYLWIVDGYRRTARSYVSVDVGKYFS